MPWTKEPCPKCEGTGNIKCEYGLTNCPACLHTGKVYEPETVRLNPPFAEARFKPGRGCGCAMCDEPMPNPQPLEPGAAARKLVQTVETRAAYVRDNGIPKAGWEKAPR